MCTRYYVELSPKLRPYIEEASHSSLKEKMVNLLGKSFKEKGEFRPTDMAAVIAPDQHGKRCAYPMIWGYHVDGLKRPLINARSESARDRKTFAIDWLKHRCVIPASYYFEWEHIPTPDGRMKAGTKYAIQPVGAEVTWLAGLYRIEQFRGLKYPVFTVLTRTPSEDLSRIHDRMPVILPEESIDAWIRPDGNPEEVLRYARTDMIFEPAAPSQQ